MYSGLHYFFPNGPAVPPTRISDAVDLRVLDILGKKAWLLINGLSFCSFMCCWYSLLSNCIGAALVQWEAGEVLGNYIHVLHSYTRKRLSLILMDKRGDHKHSHSEYFPLWKFFVKHEEQDASFNSEMIFDKDMRSSSDVSSQPEAVSSISGICNEILKEEFVRDNGSLLSLQPLVMKGLKCSKGEEEVSNTSSRSSSDWINFSQTSHCFPQKFNSNSSSIYSKLKSKDKHNFRPVTFTENILMSHFCSEIGTAEEYTFSLNPSLHVKVKSSRNNETSRMRVDSLAEQLENKHDEDFVSGISSEKKEPFDHLSASVNGELTAVINDFYLAPQKLRKERKFREAMTESFDTSCSQKKCRTSNPPGSLDGLLLFLVGIAVGVTSSFLSNKTELKRLNELLDDKKNLVRDAHEGLEMKDSLTMKELDNETGENELERYNLDKANEDLQFQNSNCHASVLKMDNHGDVHMIKVGGNFEALSEIEAELEAELERLEQNMKASCIVQRTSAFIEIDDSEISAEVSQGELREDLLVVNGSREYLTDDDSNKDGGRCATTRPCPVSPRELSLRLHQVIESRLKERVKELESALEQSRQKLKLFEMERSSVVLPMPNLHDVCCSSQDSPESLKHTDNSSQRSDSSGDESSLAFDEAYEEFSRLTEPADEKVSSFISTKIGLFSKDDASYDISGTDENDEDDSFDEGRELIQRIVEKTKQGSSAVLNAQRMFFLMDL